nr:hypothetical protein [Burkholderia ubonensis]
MSTLIDANASIRGLRGYPLRRPRAIYSDRQLRTEHGSGLANIAGSLNARMQPTSLVKPVTKRNARRS